MNQELDDYLEQQKAAQKKRTIIGIAAALGVVALILFVVTKFAGDAQMPELAEDSGEIQQAEAVEPDPPPMRRELQLNSVPEGASVIINGIASRQVTPARISVVAGERNTITLMHRGYQTKYVELSDSDNEVTVTLDEIEVPELEEDEQQLDENGDPIEPFGRINVTTRSTAGPLDGAEVWVNGQSVSGVTPVEFDVTPGVPQHITARRAGFRDAVTEIQAIRWQRREDTRQALLEMQAQREDSAFTSVKIRTAPPGAQVFIDNEEVTGDYVSIVPLNRHFTVRVEAPEYETFERHYEALVGTIDISAILQRPYNEPGMLSIEASPEDADIFIIPVREGTVSGQQVGRGTARDLEVESGEWTIRIAHGAYRERVRADTIVEVPPGEHLSVRVRMNDGELEVVDSSSRDL